MNLTAKIHKVFDEDVRSTGGSWVRAIASVNIGNDFVVHGVKVLAGTNGDTVVMPATKYKDKYQDTFHPINREAREQITSVVLDAYTRYLTLENPVPKDQVAETSEPQSMTQVM